MKKLLIILFLLIPALSQGQARQTISFGTTQEILNTTSAGSVTGTTYALPSGAAVVFAFHHYNETAPSAITVQFQVSFDGTNWTTVTTSAGLAISPNIAGLWNSGVTVYRFVRAIQTSRTGGTRTTVSVTVSRAYGIGSGPNPTVTGNLLFSPDATYDIGLTGVTRPRALYTSGNIYAGANLYANPGFTVGWDSRSRLLSPADGQITLTNAASNDFGRLNFGGTTSAFPALKRIGQVLQARLADDSGHAPLQGSALYVMNNPSFNPVGGTGLTGNDASMVNHTVGQITVGPTAFVCNATTCDVTLGTLNSRSVITGVYADLITPFACGSVCTTGTLSMTLGITAGGTQLLQSFDADAAAGVFGDADAELGSSLTEAGALTEFGSLFSWSGTTSVILRLTSGTGNIGNGTVTNLSAGSVRIHITGYRLP